MKTAEAEQPPHAPRTQIVFLLQRVRAGVWLFVAAVGVAALGDVVTQPAQMVPLLQIGLAQVAILLLVWGALRIPRLQKHVTILAVVGISSMCAAAAAAGILRNAAGQTALLLMVTSMATATLLPWGVGPQLVTVLVEAIVAITAEYVIAGNLRAVLGPQIVPVWIAFGASVYAAYELERQRRNIEQQHHALRWRSAALEAAAHGVMITDRDGHITWANPAFTHLTGYSLPEVVGKNPRLLASKMQDQAVYRSMWETILFGQVWHGEIVNRRKDGSLYTEELTITPVCHETGEIANFIAIKQDVSTRKSAEVALQQAKEAAEASSRAKSEFLANVSHEIRTPMNGILGMTELVLDTSLSSEQREYLEMVKTSADALLAIINDLLDFAKIEAGKLDLQSADFDLAHCLAETMKPMALRARQKSVRLTWSIASDVPQTLVGDAGRLRQILVNLAGNSIKFTEPEGQVELTVERAETGGQNEDRGTPQSASPATLGAGGSTVELRFAVRDSGIGIPHDKQRLIFEAFAQADGSTARRYGGTGLGLTISSQLVRLMGGQLRVDSTVGTGSTFHFTIRCELPSGVAPPVPKELAYLRGLPVLVVDDNAINRRILADTLRKWGMEPTAVDGERAALTSLEQARQADKPFALLLLDVQMPETDGFALLERIEATPHLAGATIMMLTSGDQPDDAARARALGVAAYLTKPIRQADLLGALLTTLGMVPAVEGVPVQTLMNTDGSARRTQALFEVEEPTARPEAPPPSGSASKPALSSVEGGVSAIATTVSAAPAAAGPPRLHILLAEDNVVNQRLAARILEKHGHTVVVAPSGTAVLAALERERFDLILMDVQMPEMDGLEATTEIRRRERAAGPTAPAFGDGHTAPIPIIAMTAHAMKGDEEICLQAGMDAYISKPIDPQKLFAIIEGLKPSTPETGEVQSATCIPLRTPTVATATRG